eukprot:2581881-Pyramimonas_sp.AAC.2
MAAVAVEDTVVEDKVTYDAIEALGAYANLICQGAEGVRYTKHRWLAGNVWEYVRVCAFHGD